jgi:hypothetical protein
MQPLRDFTDLAAFNRLIDSGRFRNTFKEKELVQSNRQRLMDKWVQLTQRGSRKNFKDSVQEVSMTKNTVNQLHGEITFIGRKSVLVHHFIKKRFDGSPTLIKVTEYGRGSISGSSGLFLLQNYSTGIKLHGI